MKFVTTPGPFLRDKKVSTARIMLLYNGALWLIWLFAMIYQGIVLGLQYAVVIFLIMLVSHLATLLSDVLVGILKYQPAQGALTAHILHTIKTNYSYVTATLFALILPVGTPLYVVILGAMFSTLVVKYTFGGFGANIFNPAIFGRLFVQISFPALLTVYLPGTNPASIPTLTAGATITASLQQAGWFVDSLDAFNVNWFQLLFGFYSGSIGETSTVLIIVLGAILSFYKVHNWRPTAFFYTTIFITTFIMALFKGVNPFLSSVIFFSAGSIAFGGSFMLTDPVTSPTSNFGKALIGVIAGFLVVLLRYKASGPEAVAYAIALTNIVSPTIDRLATGMINKNLLGKWAMLGGVAIASITINSSIVFAETFNSSSSSSESSSQPVTYFKTFNGSATSYNCTPTEEDCVEPELDTITVAVHVDQVYAIEAIEVSGKKASLGGWINAWNSHIVGVLEAYDALSIEGIQALDTLALPQDVLIAGVTNSSTRLAHALQDAVTDVEVYHGSFTNTVPALGVTEYTMTVTVYVENGVLSTIDLAPEGHTGGVEPYDGLWEEGYETLLAQYQGYAVADFLALPDLPPALTTAGVTYSSSRLFNAVKDALSSYGG